MSAIISPMVFVLPVFRLRAIALVWQPTRRIASSTRFLRSALTGAESLMTADTVASETSASLATSTIVGARRSGSGCDPKRFIFPPDSTLQHPAQSLGLPGCRVRAKAMSPMAHVGCGQGANGNYLHMPERNVSIIAATSDDNTDLPEEVEEGMPVTRPPLHRSVRAEVPHTAPASGRDDQTRAGVRVVDSDGWQPHSEQSMHALHVQMFLLAAPHQRAVPQPSDLPSEGLHPRPVAGHGEVARMSAHHRPQVRALLGDGLVHAPSQLLLDRQQLGAQALAAGQPEHHELA